jgi:hypothetical protein
MQFTQSSERIGVNEHNASSYVSAKFSAMGVGMIGRESTKNIDEAPSADWETTRLAYIEPVFEVEGHTAPKLAVFNTCGVGFAGDDLADLMEAGASTKLLQAQGGTNHGEGLKYASCKFNELGIVVTSRKGDVITRVKLFKGSDGLFHRAMYLAPGLRQRYLNLGPGDLSAEDTVRYERPGDFYDVKFLGNATDQNTFENPYGVANPEQDVILKEITTRFSIIGYMCPKALRLIYREQDGTETVVRSFSDAVCDPSIKFEPTKDPVTGIEVDFYYYDDSKTKINPFEKFFGHQGSRIALEYRGEQFDVLQGKDWSNKSGQYGFGGMGRNISIIIRVPGCSDNDDRTSLLVNSVPVTTKDYISEIQSLMPIWMEDLIRNNRPKAEKDLQSEFQKLLDSLTMISATQSATGSVSVTQQVQATVTKGPPRGPVINPGVSHPGAKTPGDGTGTVTQPNVLATVTMSGPQSKQVTAPDVSWVLNLSGFIDLQGKGSMFTKGSAYYYMNENFPVIDNLINQVLVNYAARSTKAVIGDDEIYEITRNEVKVHCARVVGRYIARNLAKVSNLAYSETDIYRHGLSITALTTVFESCLEDAADVWNRLRGTTAWTHRIAKLNSVTKKAHVSPEDIDKVVPFDAPTALTA